ncbi:hypothetical protein VZG28_04785 [Synechococcus elongatus IITB4]|uniref:crAss001_48 related protein n=1 Tax=Synechococcus elongatus TaxID=32046 RepID=UPI0030CA78DD
MNTVSSASLLTSLEHELAELKTRVGKLEGFIASEEYSKLGIGDKGMLDRQLKAMREYAEILSTRLERLRSALIQIQQIV